MKKPLVLTAAAAATALAAAAPAQARLITVYAGPPTGVKVTGTTALEGFYPRRPVARVGDTLRVVISTFAGVGIAPRGTALPPFLVSDASAKYQNYKDAAGNPFWFNGQPVLGIGSATMRPAGNGTFDGKEIEYSGITLGTAKPLRVKLTAAGTFVLGNSTAAAMNTTLRVVRRRAKAPSARSIRKAALREARRDLATAKKLARFSPDGSVIHAGHDRGRVALYDFFPRKAVVKQGGSLRFLLDSRVVPHNVVFGPADYRKAMADRFAQPVGEQGKPPSAILLDAQSVFPSDQGTLPPLTSELHGNGFLNTGLLDGDPNTPLTKQATVTFGQAGTFEFQCTVHPDMKGTVEVTA